MIDNKIKTLITLANTKSFTKAAQELSLTQPAVSTHIKLLEDEYKIKIFYKDRYDLKLTNEGELLLKYAKKLNVINDNLKVDLFNLAIGIKDINIGISPNIEEHIIPILLAKYSIENPKIHFIVETYPIIELYKKLKANELDIAIIDGKNNDMKYRSFCLDSDSLAVLVSSNHHLAKKEQVSIKELKNVNLILRPNKVKSRYLFEEFISSKGEAITDFNIIMEIDNTEMIKQLVKNNLGVSVVSDSSAIFDESIKTVALENMNYQKEINFIYSREYDYQDLILDIINIYNELKKEPQLTK